MDSYVSCIKIRGTPIIPPLMTDERRIEMNYYKNLALAVEEKLKKLRISNSINANKKEIDAEDLCQVYDEVSNIQFIVQPTNANITMQTLATKKVSDNNKRNRKTTDGEWRVNSDEDTITISAGINKFINISDSSEADITETTTDIAKPNVPKTLDIIPIIVESENHQTRPKFSSETEESNESIPKLVRQGSYTLDSPSPMLLAHLELSKKNYVPTCTSNGIKKRVWNSMDNKIEWRYQQTAGDSIVCQHSSGNKIHSNIRRNSISVCESNIRENKCVRDQKERQFMAGKRRVVKSVDSIPMMLTSEYNNDWNNDNKQDGNFKICFSNEECNSSNNQKFAMNENILNRNVINRFGGSLGALNNKKNSTINKKINQLNNNRLSKSFDTCTTVKHGLEHFPEKLKPITVSEKLMHVFKEIQKTHERQMTDLIARQQREQIIIQQEFQKQQLILLSKIEKSFPGIALPLLAKKMTSSINSTIQGQKCSSYNSISLPISISQNDSQNSTKYSDYTQNRSDLETSPINGSSLESDESISLNDNPLTRERSFSNLNINQERISNVSRQLFPLETKTSQEFLTNGLIYNKRHIQAATIVNAYVRGYLVRRLMKTDRIITLKNTYREALHCMLKLHVDAPLELPELNFHQRLQHQCDAASISIVELFAQSPKKKMELIAHDRQLKKIRQERPSSARSTYSFATQRTLARKKFKEMGISQVTQSSRSTCSARTRCQTWTSNSKEKRSPGIIYKGIKRSTSAGAVRKPWR